MHAGSRHALPAPVLAERGQHARVLALEAQEDLDCHVPCRRRQGDPVLPFGFKFYFIFIFIGDVEIRMLLVQRAMAASSLSCT